MPGRKLDPSEIAAATIVASLLDGRGEPLDIDEAPEGTHDFDIHLSDGRRIALEVTAADDQDVRSASDAGFSNDWRGPGLANDWWVVIGHAAEGPQVRMVKVMRQIVPSLLVLEQNLVEQVDTRVRPAHRRPLPDDRHDVLDATRMHELDVSAARSLGARRSPEAQLLVSLNAGFGSDPDKLTDLVAMLADRKAKKLALAPADQTPLRMGQGYTSRRRDCDGAVGVPDYSPRCPGRDRRGLARHDRVSPGRATAAALAFGRAWTLGRCGRVRSPVLRLLRVAPHATPREPREPESSLGHPTAVPGTGGRRHRHRRPCSTWCQRAGPGHDWTAASIAMLPASPKRWLDRRGRETPPTSSV